MRKIIGSVLVILILSLAAVYLFIPSQMSIKGSQMVYQPTSSMTRAMTQTSKWDEWMPKEIALKATSSLVATIQAELNLDGIQVPVVFSIENGEGNNSIIHYETSMNNIGWSPIERIQYYLFAKKIQNQLDLVLSAASAHYNYNKGVYGFDIVETKVKDSSYVALDKTLTDTPSLVQIYQMVDQIAAFINTQKGKAIGDPMVNITRLDENDVYIQVAIPIEKDIAVKDAFTIKKMVLGNLLSVKVQGSQTKVNEAFDATKQYITDKRKTSPAMPYVIFNTNRLLEKDSSRWVSTINYPIY
jgi:effector-binding domain-containing protein